MTLDTTKYSRFLEQVAEDIDIPPSKYQQAVSRYQAVGKWLEAGSYPGCSGEIAVYPQGSFRLGTVVRPVHGGKETDYDIDLVSELPIPIQTTDPKSVKAMVGDRLHEHGTYARLMDGEGKRCWTLEYAEQDGVGFHLDVLPSVPNPGASGDTSIAITNRDGSTYTWSASNPIGYGIWFDLKNSVAFERTVFEQRRMIQANVPDVFEKVDDVPDQLVRTPLQRSIQIMKRHRDLKFNGSAQAAFAPISIIITTLSAQFYQNERDLYSALAGIISKLQAHAVLVENGGARAAFLEHSPIKRMADGKWYIGNPVNPNENFADRWHEDNHARARAFFSWVGALSADLVSILSQTNPQLLTETLSGALGAAPVSKNIGLLIPAIPEYEPPRIHIASGTKPWRAV
jgi:hypothetical protein